MIDSHGMGKFLFFLDIFFFEVLYSLSSIRYTACMSKLHYLVYCRRHHKDIETSNQWLK